MTCEHTSPTNAESPSGPPGTVKVVELTLCCGQAFQAIKAPARARRVTGALLKMKKLDLAAPKKAYDGA